MSAFASLKQETSDAILTLRGEFSEVSPDKEEEAHLALRRLLCGVVRYPDGHIQAFNQLLTEGSDMVLDLQRENPEVIEVDTLRRLVQGPSSYQKPAMMPSLFSLAGFVGGDVDET